VDAELNSETFAGVLVDQLCDMLANGSTGNGF
jgi:hypothetical protein